MIKSSDPLREEDVESIVAHARLRGWLVEFKVDSKQEWFELMKPGRLDSEFSAHWLRLVGSDLMPTGENVMALSFYGPKAAKTLEDALKLLDAVFDDLAEEI